LKILYSCNFLASDSLQGSKKTFRAKPPGTISLAFDLATMQLSLLRERAAHTSEIYGKELVVMWVVRPSPRK
jgi:hypothetical protein